MMTIFKKIDLKARLPLKLTAAMRVDGISAQLKKQSGVVSNKIVLPPGLISLYNEMIMRNQGYPGTKVEGRNLNNLKHDDGGLLIAEMKKTCNS